MDLERFHLMLKALYENKMHSYIDESLISELQEIFPFVQESFAQISEAQKASLKAIFLKRYEALDATDFAYTSTVARALSCNAPWIKLAKVLCENDALYSCHYYQLLMP